MATIENEMVFRRAVRYGFRTHDIAACTRTSAKRIRYEFRAVHGSENPPTGKKPSSSDVIFRSPEIHRQASIYFALLCSVRLIVPRGETSTVPMEMATSAGLDACIDAIYVYHQLYPEAERHIDATKAFSLVRKFFLGLHLDLVACRDCGSPYVVEAAVPAARQCPFCQERRALLNQCRSCRAPLSDAGRCTDPACRRRSNIRHRFAPAVYHCSALGGGS